MARRRAIRRIPEWAVGLALMAVVPAPAWMRPPLLDGVEGRLLDLRLRWVDSRAPSHNIVAVDEVSIQITSSPPPPVASDSTGRLPLIFPQLIDKSLAKDPAQRFQSGEKVFWTLGALKDRLDQAQAQAWLTATARPTAPATQSQAAAQKTGSG